MTETLTDGLGSSADREVLDALDAIAEASEASSELAEQVTDRAQEIRAQRASGDSWQDIVASGSAPSVIEIVTETVGALTRATGRLRRSLLRALIGEGLSHVAIADLFGLSRQRIGAILKQGGSPGSRTERGSSS